MTMGEEVLEYSEEYLAESFHHRGYVRQPDRKKKEELGSSYKKGYEVRFVTCSEEELEELRQCLRSAGFKPSKPYSHGRNHVQPVYGKKNTERLRKIYSLWLEKEEETLRHLRNQSKTSSMLS